MADYDVQCYTSAHTLWLIFVGAPAIICYVLGIPAISYYLMRKRHNDGLLFTARSKFQLGKCSAFCTALHSPSSQAFCSMVLRTNTSSGSACKLIAWTQRAPAAHTSRCSVLVRKVAVVLVSVVVAQVNVIVQTLAGLGVVTISLILHYKYTPYESSRLNSLETVSLCVSAATLYIGT